jgi:hypothetical protein
MRQCAAVRGSLKQCVWLSVAVCGSLRQFATVRQCAVVNLAVCGSARAAFCGSKHGSVRQHCGSVRQCARRCVVLCAAVCGCPAVRQCAAVWQCAAVRGSLKQCVQRCAAICRSLRQCGSVQQCGSPEWQCVAVRHWATVQAAL